MAHMANDCDVCFFSAHALQVCPEMAPLDFEIDPFSTLCGYFFVFFLRSFSVCLLISLRIKHGNKLTNIQKIVVLKMNTILNSYYYCWNAMNE